jgi:hypothetical protein
MVLRISASFSDSSAVGTQCGQPRAYADSIYAGTVWADSEQEAREKLAKMRYTEILDKQDKERWHLPYFTKFRAVKPREWEFSITEEYTG